MSQNASHSSFYEVLGGEQGLREIVHHFYRHMQTDTEAEDIKLMHTDFARAEQKLFEFLSGWTGGPQLFVEKYGHPMLRARHLPFKIGKKERDQWMFCMALALDDCQIPELVQSEFMKALFRLADHMRNQQE